MKKTYENRPALLARLVALLSVTAMLGATGARVVRAEDVAAADPPKKAHRHRTVVTTTPTITPITPGPSVEHRLDGLTADVTNLKASS
ncbi:MAG TPA: hypothetical protein VGI47_02585, partial [Candidatus Binataceae bacterium]